MTLIKSLLLGSAAGLVAVASAQAADLPTRKAAPVAEYVKICNIGGVAGFVIPGSDTCLKISGGVGVEGIFVQRSSANIETAGGTAQTNVPWRTAVINNAEEFQMDGRGWITLDAANNTPYGPVTSEAEINANTGGSGNGGLAGNYGASSSPLDHAWLKWAGLEAHLNDGSLFNNNAHSPAAVDEFEADTGGAAFLAYIPHFAGGWYVGVSVEDAKSHYFNNSNAGVAFYPANIQAGGALPDFAAAAGVDQAWGGAKVAAIFHQTTILAPGNGTLVTHNGWGVDGMAYFNATANILVDLRAEYVDGFMDGIWQGTAANTNGNDYLLSDLLTNATGTVVAYPQAWGIAGDVIGTFGQFKVAPYASYAHVSYSGLQAASPVPQNLYGWNAGVNLNWQPITNIGFNLDIMYYDVHVSQPGSAAGLAWANANNGGWYSRLQVTRSF